MSAKLAARALVLACVLGQAPACQQKATVTESQTYFSAPTTNLLLPRLDNWKSDDSIPELEPNQAGVVLRLMTREGVLGSPRIEVTREAATSTPSVLEDWLTRGLREMGQLENSGAIRILHVDQERIQVASLPAYRVHHEFTSGKGSSQISLYQVALFLVIDGRGITISAAGRTELFHPLAPNISQILDNIALGSQPRRASGGLQAIDLGRVGGKH